MKRSIAIVLILILAGGAGWYFYARPQGGSASAPAGGPPPGGGQPPPPVPVYVVVPETVPLFREYPASTRAVNSVEIRAKATGYILKREFQEGADVKLGDLLYMIDPRDYQAAVDKAKAQLDADSAALRYAQSSLQRVAQLVPNAYATRDSFDKATSDANRLQAQVALDRAQLRSAELDLSYTTIRSPIDGRIGQAGFNVGSLVSAANTLLTTVVQLDPIYVSFNPSESDLTALNAARQNGTVEIALTRIGEAEAKFKGALDFVNNAVDASTGTITMRGTVPNPQKELLPGQFVRVRVSLGERANAILVPQRAIASDQSGKYVFVVGPDNKLQPRPLKLGVAFGDRQLVESGLQGGDQVVTEGLLKLGPGMTVQPKPLAAAAK